MTPAERAAEIAELPPLEQYRAIEKLVAAYNAAVTWREWKLLDDESLFSERELADAVVQQPVEP